jgi:hypothetical protein
MLYRIYLCARCGTAKRIRADHPVHPTCCTLDMQWKRTTTMVDPPAPRFGKAPGIDCRVTNPIVVPIGGGIKFESLHDLRRFERESEMLANEGIGQPYRIRGYSQDHGNMEKNTFGESPQETPDLSRTHPDGTPRVQVTKYTPDSAEMGPGADEALASALPLEP